MNKDKPVPQDHELKTWSKYFQQVFEGQKTFEIRLDDRGFNAGDTLTLREFDRFKLKYTGRQCKRVISYILRGAEEFGLTPGFVIMALQHPLESQPGNAEFKLSELQGMYQWALKDIETLKARVKELEALLLDIEKWEATVISDNDCWTNEPAHHWIWRVFENQNEAWGQLMRRKNALIHPTSLSKVEPEQQQSKM